MPLKDVFLKALKDPNSVRQLFFSQEIKQKLELIGIEVTIYELHQPAIGAKKTFGLGKTLCGRDRSMRNRYVTCKNCLAKIEKLKKNAEFHATLLDWDDI